jgi:hypothetical protein
VVVVEGVVVVVVEGVVVVLGVVGVVVVVVECCVKWPTTIVTALPFLALAPGPGLWEITIPSRLCFVTSWVRRDTVNPAPVSADVACCGVSPLTSGTFTLGCALATTIVTVDPETSLVPPDGVWLTTLPGVVVSDVVVVVLTLKPAFWSALVAESCDWPTTFGTVTIGLPEDTNTVTGVPTAGF